MPLAPPVTSASRCVMRVPWGRKGGRAGGSGNGAHPAALGKDRAAGGVAGGVAGQQDRRAHRLVPPRRNRLMALRSASPNPRWISASCPSGLTEPTHSAFTRVCGASALASEPGQKRQRRLADAIRHRRRNRGESAAALHRDDAALAVRPACPPWSIRSAARWPARSHRSRFSTLHRCWPTGRRRRHTPRPPRRC